MVDGSPEAHESDRNYFGCPQRTSRHGRAKPYCRRIMDLRTVVVTRRWSIERPGARVRLTCDIARVRRRRRSVRPPRLAKRRTRVFAAVGDPRGGDGGSRAALSDLLSAGWCAEAVVLEAP